MRDALTSRHRLGRSGAAAVVVVALLAAAGACSKSGGGGDPSGDRGSGGTATAAAAPAIQGDITVDDTGPATLDAALKQAPAGPPTHRPDPQHSP